MKRKMKMEPTKIDWDRVLLQMEKEVVHLYLI